MQHMVSLVQLGVLRSVRAGGELHCTARHLAAPRTPYAAFVKEIINSIAPEDGRIGPKHAELK